MAVTKNMNIADLCLDLANFRTIHQPDEIHAVEALIAIKPDRFWALMESLLDDGYMHFGILSLMKQTSSAVRYLEHL